jgi:hypothetical protein
MTDLHFTERDIWSGGFYELAIEIGSPSDENLLNALRTIWSYPAVEGGWLEHDREPSEQEQVVPNSEHLQSGSKLFGIAHLPDATEIVCGTFLVREEEGSDWLGFYIPRGALDNTYYPMDQDDTFEFDSKAYYKSIEIWRNVIDPWLAEIGQYVYRMVPFRLGLIGLEVSGEINAAELAIQGIPPYERRNIGYLVPESGQLEYQVYPAELKYYPYSAKSNDAS